MKWFFLKGVRIYQLCFSPFFGGDCRFYPSCSQYCRQVLHKYHWLRACHLSLCRILKCHPWHPGGVDLP